MADMIDIGKRLRRIRKEIRYDQSDMAILLDVSIAQYGRYERGEIPVPVTKLYNLIRDFGYNLNWLLTGEGGMVYPTHIDHEREVYELRNKILALKEENLSLKENVKKIDEDIEQSRASRRRSRRNPIPGVEGA